MGDKYIRIGSFIQWIRGHVQSNPAVKRYSRVVDSLTNIINITKQKKGVL